MTKKIECAITRDYRGNPKIKITQDCPQITLDVYTDDINLLQSWVDEELIICQK